MGFSPPDINTLQQQNFGPQQQVATKFFKCPECPPCAMSVWREGFLDRPLQFARSYSDNWADLTISFVLLTGAVILAFYFPPTKRFLKYMGSIINAGWEQAKTRKQED